MRCCVVLVLACACGRVNFEEVGGGGAGGTRLKHLRYAFADGARATFGYYDSLRDEPCTIMEQFEPLQCIPEYAPALFADAACTHVIGHFDNNPNAAYIGVITLGRLQLYTKGAMAGMMAYSVQRDGSCYGFTTSQPTFELGAEVPSTDLATLDTTLLPGGRLMTREYTMSDGFREQASAYDSELASSCSARPVSGGWGCSPSEDVGDADFFTDSACTNRVIARPPTASPARFGFYREGNTCSGDVTLIEAGAMLPSASLYEDLASACSPSLYHDMDKIVAAGPVVPLVPLARAAGVEQGQRVAQYVFEGSGARFLDLEFYGPALFDTALGVDCIVQRTTGDMLRCVPSSIYTTTYYTDAACTTPIDVGVNITGPGCVPDPPPYIFTGQFQVMITGLFERGPVYGATLYQVVGTCVMVPSTSAITYYQLGAAVDLATLPEATIVRE